MSVGVLWLNVGIVELSLALVSERPPSIASDLPAFVCIVAVLLLCFRCVSRHSRLFTSGRLSIRKRQAKLQLARLLCCRAPPCWLSSFPDETGREMPHTDASIE